VKCIYLYRETLLVFVKTTTFVSFSRFSRALNLSLTV